MSHISQADLKLPMLTENEVPILLLCLLRLRLQACATTRDLCDTEELNPGLPAHEARTWPTKSHPQPFIFPLTPKFTVLSRGKN